MAKRSNTAHGDARGEKYAPAPADHSLAGRFESVRLLLDEGRSSEAESLPRRAHQGRARRREPARTLARRALRRADAAGPLPRGARRRRRLRVARGAAPPDVPRPTSTSRAQLGLAYNYTGDYPKAIALLNAALRDAAEQGADAQRGALYAALARVYRSINEYPIARDHSQRALEHYPPRGRLARAGRGLLRHRAGRHLAGQLRAGARRTPSRRSSSSATARAPYLLGKIYANMAGACWFLKRPHDGIRYLEKAIGYYERTEHKANAALGYNNLGINLIARRRLGARAGGARSARSRSPPRWTSAASQVPMILDSLGELRHAARRPGRGAGAP